MTILKSTRIESIDLLRGLVMVIMALDHTRDYFNLGSFYIDPLNLETTTTFTFFTRFVTHFCAPVFVFLAGTSAFLYGSKKTKAELSKFLLSRGIWLVFLEIVVNNLIWTFDFSYSFNVFQVIWAIGMSMVFLSFLIYLPRKLLLILGLILVAGHNMLDGIIMKGDSFSAILWYLLHQENYLVLAPNKSILFGYPIIPWIGVMILGYSFGILYSKGFDPLLRKKWLLRLGLGSVVLFLVIRGINVYGDLVPWSVQKDITFSVLSFVNTTKYPPSLVYILMTIGPSILFLYLTENIKNRFTDFLVVFGRVPLLFYFLHVFVIHLLAIIGILIFGGNWQDMIVTAEAFSNETLITYGYPLHIVYIIWIGIIVFLYPICKKYMYYKLVNKNKKWLSYL